MKAKEYFSIGLMSGTSMDGVDAALISTNGIDKTTFIDGATVYYPSDLKAELRNLELQIQNDPDDYKEILKNNSLTVQKSAQYHLLAVQKLFNKLANINKDDIKVVGYHGQSVYHNPRKKLTIQFADPEILAKELALPIAYDFRADDIKLGGQGAPLAPIYHHVLVNQSGLVPAAVINCGGIANVSFIENAIIEHATGFDVGPGNVLLDRFIRTKTNGQEFMDEDGKYGLKGKVNLVLVDKQLKKFQPFLQAKPPKSLDPLDLPLLPAFYDLTTEDAAASLAFITAKTIADSISNYSGTNLTKWILCGGGWKNPVILEYLQQLCPPYVDLYSADALGWSSAYMEAELIAFLAVRVLLGMPITYPRNTGCSIATTGGKTLFSR